MKEVNFKIHFDVSPEVLFDAWLSSKTHSEMIGADADISPIEGGQFSDWDGSVVGRTLRVDKGKFLIHQSWYYSYNDWPKDSPSEISLKFNKSKTGGCDLEFKQINLPEKYAQDIKTGWEEYYWKPMREYFNK